ncbi:hypothetical protein ES705_41167 [subsurface metagenome]
MIININWFVFGDSKDCSVGNCIFEYWQVAEINNFFNSVIK